MDRSKATKVETCITASGYDQVEQETAIWVQNGKAFDHSPGGTFVNVAPVLVANAYSYYLCVYRNISDILWVNALKAGKFVE